jgi:hypothetical protein
MGDVFLNFKNGLLEITYVEKLLQIITLFFQKIFTEQTSQNEISIKNWYTFNLNF